MGEQGAEHMRLRAREEPDRGCMASIVVSGDQIDGMGIVELVDLVLPIDDRHVPAKQVDEQPLAIGEHGLEQRPVPRRQMVVDDVDHEVLPLVVSLREEQRRISGNRPSDYSG